MTEKTEKTDTEEETTEDVSEEETTEEEVTEGEGAEEEPNRERRQNPFEDVFSNLFSEVDEMVKELNKAAQEGHKQRQQEREERRRNPHKRIGRFDDLFTKGGFRRPQTNIETHLDEEQFYVYVDLPGVESENIDIRAKPDEIEITAESNDEDETSARTRSYNIRRRLPYRVKPETATAVHNNGVLEVTFDLETHAEGTEVDIE